MRFATLCSGIDAPGVAWKHLGWTPVFHSEIEPFPSAVLAHHDPDVPNLGDMTAPDFTKRAAKLGPVDLLVAGTPCQAFSLAGQRQSLDDERGNLTLKFTEICDDLKPTWVVWENVPGVLNTPDNAFGCLLGKLVGSPGPLVSCGGRWRNAGMAIGPRRAAAWRILDAQHYRVPQRRRRVFVIAGHPRNTSRIASILFEPEGVPRDFETRKKTEKNATRRIAKCLRASGSDYPREGDGNYIVMAHGQASAECVRDGSPALTCNHEAPIISLTCGDRGITPDQACAGMLQKDGGGVRRLTPLECERLQGFPDNYTNIKYGKPRFPDQICPDGPRYKALGNSMAVPVMRWLGKRIAVADKTI